MAALSDLIGGSGGNAPDAGASLLERVQSNKAWYEYKPISALAPGKYVVKASANGKGTLRVSANTGAFYEAIGGNQAVIDITSSTTNLQMAYENWENVSQPLQRIIPRYFPNNVANTSNWVAYSGRNAMACDPTGRTWVQVNGQLGAVWRSTDFGRTWQSLGRLDQLVGVTTTNYESYVVLYALGRFIIAAGPTDADGTAVSIGAFNGLGWSRLQPSNGLHAVVSAATNGTSAVFGRYIQTSNNIVYTTDGVNFTRTSATNLTGRVWFIMWDGTRYIACDDAQRLSTSTDGVTWTSAVTLPFSVKSMVYVNNVYYAISNTGVLQTSADLLSWAVGATLSTATNTNHQLWNRGSLIVYYDPNNGQIRTSTNGTDWVTRVTGINQFGSLNLCEGRFWYFDSGNYHRSDDGLDWSTRPQIVGTNTVTGCAFGQGLHVAVGGAQINTSPDGYVWTSRTSNTGQAINAISYNESNAFVYAANAGNIGRSPDGITWTLVSSNSLTSNNVHDVAFGNGRWVVVGNTSTQIATSTDNGLTWSNVTVTSATGGQAMNAVAYGGGLWAAVGNAGRVMTSSDGVSWTAVDPATQWRNIWGGRVAPTLAWFGIVYGNGRFVIVGDRSTGYSTDGITWYFRDNNAFITAGVIRGVEYKDNRFVAYGDGGMAWYSNNGVDWFTIQTGFNATNIFSYSYGNGFHFFGGASGVYRTSSDITYFPTSPGDFSVSTSYMAAYGGKYLITNSNGIWTTSDWNIYDRPVHNRVGGQNFLIEVVYGNGVYVAVANSTRALYWSPNGVNWMVAKSGDGITDIRGNNVIFADGRFWKIWSTRLAYSIDGHVWYDVHVFPSNAPTLIKKTNGYFAAFGAANQTIYFHRDLVNRPDGWTVGQSSQTTGNVCTDIASVNGLTVFCYNGSNPTVAPTIFGQNLSNPSPVYSYLGESVNGVPPMWNAFNIGNKIFGYGNQQLWEVRPESDQYNSTSTNFNVMARSWRCGAWGINSYMTLSQGNTCVAVGGAVAYEMTAESPVTFSIYNSTVPTVN